MYFLPVWQKIGICLLVLIIPTVLFWYFFLAGRLEEMHKISEKIPRLKQEIIILEARSRDLPQLKKELQTMNGILETALKLLPEKKDIPSFLPEISSLGNEAGLDFLSFKPQQEQTKNFYAAIPIKMEFNGPFHNIVDFFDNVSQMPRIVHIKSVSMGKAKQTTEVWSQKGSLAGNPETETAPESSSAQDTGEGVAEDHQAKRSSTWIISTLCEAETYRFLSPEEQQAAKKQRNKKRR